MTTSYAPKSAILNMLFAFFIRSERLVQTFGIVKRILTADMPANLAAEMKSAGSWLEGLRSIATNAATGCWDFACANPNMVMLDIYAVASLWWLWSTWRYARRNAALKIQYDAKYAEDPFGRKKQSKKND